MFAGRVIWWTVGLILILHFNSTFILLLSGAFIEELQRKMRILNKFEGNIKEHILVKILHVSKDLDCWSDRIGRSPAPAGGHWETGASDSGSESDSDHLLRDCCIVWSRHWSSDLRSPEMTDKQESENVKPGGLSFEVSIKNEKFSTINIFQSFVNI